MKACTESSAGIVAEGVRHCSQKEVLSQQSLLASPPCIVVDNIHRGKKSTTKAHIRSANTSSNYRQHHLAPEALSLHHSPSRISHLPSRIHSRNTISFSTWSSRNAAADRSSSKRYLHTTRSQRSFFSQDGGDGLGLSLEQKRLILAELRQKAFVKANTKQLWASYTKMVKAEALPLLQSDDVTVLFQALSRSEQTEESMEMMLQVALDVNDMGKQLPQEAFDILMQQAVDHLPAEQIKVILWQIQGRRRFITEFIQLCDSNLEMRRFLGLYNQLARASFDVDGFSTYFQSRKERAEALGDIVLRWIKDEGKDVNPKVVENLLVFLLDRGVIDNVYTTVARLSKEGFKFTHGFFTTAIHRFGRAQKFDYMDITVDIMKKQGLEPLEDTYSAIIDAHSHAGNLREAQRAYQDVLAADLTPTDTTFGPMVEAVGKMGDYDMTRQLVDQMNASGVPSNEYTLSALLQSLSNDPDRSAALFLELSKQVEPNTVNFNLLIRTFQRHGDLDGAFRVFRSMITDRVRPDQYTFSSILSLFASRGDAEGAEVFWNEMVDAHKVMPNAHAYGAMMHVYCTTEDMLSAQTVYREMIQASIMPNEVIFGTLLNAYARRGDLTQMLSIYDAMRAEGLKPNSYIYSNLLFGLVKDGDMSAARRMYENMEEDGFGNNVLAQTILMKGYLDQDDFKGSQEVYKNMLRAGLIPNFMTYATLLQAHAKRGETKEGRAFLNKIMNSRGLVMVGGEDESLDDDEMEKLGISQSQDRTRPTYAKGSEQEAPSSGLLEGHLSTIGTERKPLKTAARPQALMAFTPLLDAYAKESNILAAKDIFDEIKARGLEPNTTTYTMLMDGYRRAGDVESVMRIWDELFERFKKQQKDIRDHPERYRPFKHGHAVEWAQDRMTTKAWKLRRLLQRPISITLDSLCYSGRISEAKAIWSELDQLGFEFDSANWNDYCIALIRNGLLMEACHIVQEKLLPGFESELELSHSTLSPRAPSPPRRVHRVSGNLGSDQNDRSHILDMDRSDLEPNTAVDGEESGSTKHPMTLLYPRPRTFAALADSLEDLLSPKGDKRVRYQDQLSNPIIIEPEDAAMSTGVVSSSESSAAKLQAKIEKRRRLIEAKLQPYPRPFEKLEENHRQIMWSLIRTEYPRVLEALDEGILVTTTGPLANRSATALQMAQPSSELDEFEEKFKSKKDRSLSTVSEQDQQPQQQQQGGFIPFRQWRRLKSVMRDRERKQFLEDRKTFIQEREDRFALLRGRKPV
ncbi:hypothetical protein BGZ58_006801 [Dissophora ornata]|nr:hypothetical protein BGZ58_006801 [Dissophora ornata]